MIKNKSNLENMLDKFYANEVLREVYTSEKAIVCNVFNQYYVAFSKDICKKYEDQFPGFIVNSQGLRTIVEDDNYINYHFEYLSEETKGKSLALVDEVLLQHMTAHKSEFSKRPPKVDLEYEQQLIAEQERKKELAAMMETSTNANTIVLQNASQK